MLTLCNRLGFQSRLICSQWASLTPRDIEANAGRPGYDNEGLVTRQKLTEGQLWMTCLL